MVWITLEGCIGVGKSTIIDAIQKRYKGIKLIPEPIHEWETCLELFYKDKKKYSLLNQLNIMISFIEIQNIVTSEEKNNFITERSVYSAHNIFNKLLYNNNNMSQEEFDTLAKIHKLHNKEPDYFIYLRSNSATCINRIDKRGDKPIELDYLNKVICSHETYFKEKTNSFIVDVYTKSVNEIVSEIVKILKNIGININE